MSVCAVLGVVLLLVTCTPFVDGWAAMLARPWDEAKGDILIVLTGGVIGGGDPGGAVIGDSSYWRALYAVRAWREGGFHEILISGAQPNSGVMREFLLSQGVPASAIVLEDRSTSTRESALNVAEMLRGSASRKVLLTSDYHFYRSYRAFRKAGMEIGARPIPDARKRATSWRYRWWVFVDLCGETGKLGYYAARGWA